MEPTNDLHKKMPERASDLDLHRLDRLSTLLDNKFTVWGVRFGIDPLIGLIPYVGDITGLGVTIVLLRTISKKGASIGILCRIFGNLILDAIIGIFPVVGDMLDIAHKANRKNVNLLRAYYADPTPKPPAGIALAILTVLLMALVIGMLWLSKWCLSWMWHHLFA